MRSSTVSDLARSGLTAADAEAAGMFDVANAATVYPSDFNAEAALVIPYFDIGGALVRWGPDGKAFCRIRYTERTAPAPGFTKRKQLRYSQPARSGVHAYFAPVLDWQRLASDPSEPLLIVEGEKKTLAGIKAGFPVIGLGGVFNFADISGNLLPELEEFEWNRRDCYIVFDSDAALNPNILAAEARLVDELQTKRGARCYLVRLPQVGEHKCGLDDFLLAHGVDDFKALLQTAPALGALDAKVVSLNKSVAWIERENMVYDLEARMFIPKDSFTTGSRFSTLKHITVGGKQRSAPKPISVAATWLTHPHARRYGEILFRPGEGAVVNGEHGRPALNMWTGWDSEPGDVTPFLKLTEFLFQNMRPEDRDLPLRLMAYKAQHPEEKVPLALVLIGEQGCGKTLWLECIREAFSPYSADITPASLAGEFQGWLERTLFVAVNEVKGEDLMAAKEQLKALISDLKRPMNEKYRPVRQINTYSMYALSSNNRSVGAFAADDRRMIVVSCPPKLTTPEGQALYDTLGQRHGAWFHDNGPRKLLHHLLTMDLKGWRPPSAAPMSAEKYMAYIESLTPIQRLAEDMKTADQHTVVLWLDTAMAWAQNMEVSGSGTLAAVAVATRDNVLRYQVRPFYTPEELAMMFPAVVQNLLGSKMAKSTPAGMISRELRDAGVKYLTCSDDPRGFHWKGRIQQFLIVSEEEEWAGAPLSQAEFERAMGQFPTYGQLREQRMVPRRRA